jgi:transposase
VHRRFRGHHAFLVTQILAHLDYLDETIGTISQEIEIHIAPFADAIRRWDAIPGINQRAAEVVIAELGVDMTVFPSDRHVASWAGICPRNNESAGKHKAGTTRKGNRWLRALLVETALAVSGRRTGRLGLAIAA